MDRIGDQPAGGLLASARSYPQPGHRRQITYPS